MTKTPNSRRQVHLAAHFPGVNNTTVWADPASGSNIEFESFKRLAQTAERGFFDFFFLAEGLRLREHRGKIVDLDVVGRPDSVTVLSALAAVTEHIGLAATLSATNHEPYELARQLATLDHLSAGRAGWNVVTSSSAFTGANFRRGGYLEYADRYNRANDFISVTRELWESWPENPAGPDADSATRGSYEHASKFFDIGGTFPVPRSPQVHPVVFQAGDSDAGREFGASVADIIFTRHSTLEAGKAFYADLKRRLPRYGRHEDDLKIYPGVTFVLGDTPAEAEERAAEVRLQQISGAGAIAYLETVWNADLSGYDPDGPLPDVDPDFEGKALAEGRAILDKDARSMAKVQAWRDLAEAKRLSIRQLVIEVSGNHSFVGTPGQVAADLDLFVQERAVDGFIIQPHITPDGLEEFVDKVVPELQERGVYRDSYPGKTMRENLELGEYRPAAVWSEWQERALAEERAESEPATEKAV